LLHQQPAQLLAALVLPPLVVVGEVHAPHVTPGAYVATVASGHIQQSGFAGLAVGETCGGPRTGLLVRVGPRVPVCRFLNLPGGGLCDDVLVPGSEPLE